MDGAESGLGQADPRAERGRRHRGARAGGGGRTAHPRDRHLVPGEQPVASRGQSAQSQAVGDGIGTGRQVRLEQLRKRVHAVGRDQLRRAAPEQFRVQDRDPGDQRLVAK